MGVRIGKITYVCELEDKCNLGNSTRHADNLPYLIHLRHYGNDHYTCCDTYNIATVCICLEYKVTGCPDKRLRNPIK